MTTADAESKKDEDNQSVLEMFMEHLDVDAEVAGVLVQEGFTTLEEVAYVQTQEMTELEAFDEQIVEQLRNSDRDVLLNKTISQPEERAHSKQADDLTGDADMEKAKKD